MTKENQEELIKTRELIKMAKGMLEELSSDEEFLQAYYAHEKARLEEASKLKDVESKSMEKGIEKGATIKAKEMAQELIKDGMEIPLVAKYTKLTITEVEEIKKDMQ